MTDSLKAHLEKVLYEVRQGRSEHLEMFAAAYLKRTCIDPREAVLCEQTKDGVCRWWFERKEHKYLVPKPFKVFASWDEVANRYRLETKVTQADLDGNKVYELDKSDFEFWEREAKFKDGRQAL